MSTHFTANCKLGDLAPQMNFALIILREIYEEEKIDLWITSIDDSRHSRGSLHYKGRAFDLRTRHMAGGYTGSQAKRITAKIKSRLGKEFDVILEGNHIHLEYDPD